MTTTTMQAPINAVLTAIPDEYQQDPFEAMRYAGLDWTAQDRRLAFERPDGTWQPLVRHKVIVRSDDLTGHEWPFTPVGHRFQAVQHGSTLFGAAETMLNAGMIEGIVQAGQVADGARAYVVLSLGESALLVDDPHSRHIIAMNAHDGTLALRAKFMAERFFCANQVPYIGQGRAAVSLRHTASLEWKVSDFAGMLTSFMAQADAYEREYLRLMGKAVTARQLSRFVERLFPDPKGVLDDPRGGRAASGLREKRTIVFSLARGGEANANLLTDAGGPTAASLFQAAVEFSDHYRRTRGDGARSRGLAVLDGKDVAFKRRAWDLARQID